MLSGSTARISISADQTGVTSQQVETTGNSSVTATVNGVEVVNAGSNSGRPSSMLPTSRGGNVGSISQAAGPTSSGNLGSRSARLNQARTRFESLRGQFQTPRSNAGQEDSVARASFVIDGNGVVSQDIQTSGNGQVTAFLNGMQIV
jgi:hypothetical protein